MLAWAGKDIRASVPLKHVVKNVALARRFITDEEYRIELKQSKELAATPFKKDGTPLEKLQHDSRLVACRHRSERIVARYEAQIDRAKNTLAQVRKALHAFRATPTAPARPAASAAPGAPSAPAQRP